ncbi:hypothetical protein GCM10027300_12640 [Modestobacter lapidis]
MPIMHKYVKYVKYITYALARGGTRAAMSIARRAPSGDAYRMPLCPRSAAMAPVRGVLERAAQAQRRLARLSGTSGHHRGARDDSGRPPDGRTARSRGWS